MKLYFVLSCKLLKFSFKPAKFLAKTYCIHAAAMIKSYLRVRHQRSSHCKAPGIAAALFRKRSTCTHPDKRCKEKTDEKTPHRKVKTFLWGAFHQLRIIPDNAPNMLCSDIIIYASRIIPDDVPNLSCSDIIVAKAIFPRSTSHFIWRLPCSVQQ